MSTKKTKPEVIRDIAPTELTVAAPAAAVGVIEKVKLMNDLANACQDSAVVAAINKLPNGETIFNIFTAAVHKEISKIMTNEPEEEAPATKLAETIGKADSTIAQLGTLVDMFTKTPLVKIFGQMNDKIGAAMPAPQQAAPNTAPQQQQQRSSTYDPIPVGGRGSGATGLGSF